MVSGFCPKIGNKPQKNKIPVAHKATARLYDGIIISQRHCTIYLNIYIYDTWPVCDKSRKSGI